LPLGGKHMINSEKIKEYLEKHGSIQSQSINDWKGIVSLPKDIEIFYKEIGPNNIYIKSYGNPYFLPSLDKLWDFQAGYRWNGKTGEMIHEWNKEWFVIADEGGNPFIYSAKTTKIYFSEHGNGEWELKEIFNNLFCMAASLAILGKLVKEAGKTFLDENCFIYPKYLSLAKEYLADTLDNGDLPENTLNLLGWC